MSPEFSHFSQSVLYSQMIIIKVLGMCYHLLEFGAGYLIQFLTLGEILCVV